jgi:hypothetical protein
VPSVSRQTSRLLALGSVAALLAGASAGCSTTQEKAAKHQAEAKRILDAREKRQRKKHADGTKTGDIDRRSAHRPQEEGAQ